MRLGFGDYEEPDHPEPNWATRDFFLGVVAKMAPEVLEELRSLVLALYSELPDELRQRPPKYVEAELKDGWSVIERAEASESVRRFKEALIAWASSHGLQVDWVLNRALATLHAWSRTTDALSATTPPPRHGLQVRLTIDKPTRTRDAASATTPSPQPLRFSGINRSWGIASPRTRCSMCSSMQGEDLEVIGRRCTSGWWRRSLGRTGVSIWTA